MRPKSVCNLKILPLCKNSTFDNVMLKSKLVGNLKTNIILLKKMIIVKSIFLNQFIVLFFLNSLNQKCLQISQRSLLPSSQVMKNDNF